MFEVKRGDEDLNFEVKLAKRPDTNGGGRRWEQMNRMGGRISDRVTGFERIVQHDIPLAPEECGGAVINLDGDVVGINVSRAGRVKTYAVPSDEILGLLKNLPPIQR
jgi:serine protease Do